MLCKEDITEKTCLYWSRQEEYHPEDYLTYYIQNLLRDELSFAKQLEQEKQDVRLPKESCQTLVLLVGYSIEPLLQSICAYRPDHIVFIVNTHYHNLSKDQAGNYSSIKGEKFVKKYIQPLLPQLVEMQLLPQIPTCEVKQIEAATPSEVFKALLEGLREKPNDIVIDVTGGKKSMVTGAYLYAAFAHGVTISYVDFDDDVYDPKKGKPFGFGCRIGKLANPYNDFALRNWEQLRSFYQHYNFRAARELLIGPDGSKGEGTLWKTASHYVPELCAAIEKLADVLEFYRLWDDGDYGAAYARKDQLSIAQNMLPSAVLLLGSDWFRFTGTQFTSAQDFFDDDERLRAYVHDELARIKRLIDFNEDYRSAFLRAGGLNEVLMVSRWVRQCTDLTQKTCIIRKLQSFTPQISDLFKDLQQAVSTQVGYKLVKKQSPISFPLQEKMITWWLNINPKVFNDWDDFTVLRNKIAHTYLSVPKELAEAALAFVQANFDDFRKIVPDTRPSQTNAIRWSDLCKACEIDQWLHPTLCAD